MLPTNPLDAIPLWAAYLITIALCLLAAEAGYQLGLNWQKRAPEKDTAIGPMVAASLGLLAFLLAFLTSIAAGRFDTRRQLVMQDANAIGTTYLRAGYLPESYSTHAQTLLKEYVDVRINAVKPGGNLAAGVARSEQIQEELWQDVERFVRETGGSDVYALYIDSLNQMIDLHSERVIAGVYARLPLTLLLTVYGIALLTMMILGFANSYDHKRSGIALTILVLIFSSVLILNVDLDRSGEGLLQVSQQPMINLQQQLNR